MIEPKKDAAAKSVVAGYGKAMRDAYKAIAVASAADARTSLDARRALFALRDGREIPSDVADVLKFLAAFERSLVEADEDAVVEQKREACMRAMDRLMIDRGIRGKAS